MHHLADDCVCCMLLYLPPQTTLAVVPQISRRFLQLAQSVPILAALDAQFGLSAYYGMLVVAAAASPGTSTEPTRRHDASSEDPCASPSNVSSLPYVNGAEWRKRFVHFFRDEGMSALFHTAPASSCQRASMDDAAWYSWAPELRLRSRIAVRSDPAVAGPLSPAMASAATADDEDVLTASIHEAAALRCRTVGALLLAPSSTCTAAVTSSTGGIPSAWCRTAGDGRRCAAEGPFCVHRDIPALFWRAAQVTDFLASQREAMYTTFMHSATPRASASVLRLRLPAWPTAPSVADAAAATSLSRLPISEAIGRIDAVLRPYGFTLPWHGRLFLRAAAPCLNGPVASFDALGSVDAYHDVVPVRLLNLDVALSIIGHLNKAVMSDDHVVPASQPTTLGQPEVPSAFPLPPPPLSTSGGEPRAAARRLWWPVAAVSPIGGVGDLNRTCFLCIALTPLSGSQRTLGHGVRRPRGGGETFSTTAGAPSNDEHPLRLPPPSALVSTEALYCVRPTHTAYRRPSKATEAAEPGGRDDALGFPVAGSVLTWFWRWVTDVLNGRKGFRGPCDNLARVHDVLGHLSNDELERLNPLPPLMQFLPLSLHPNWGIGFSSSTDHGITVTMSAAFVTAPTTPWQMDYRFVYRCQMYMTTDAAASHPSLATARHPIACLQHREWEIEEYDDDDDDTAGVVSGSLTLPDGQRSPRSSHHHRTRVVQTVHGPGVIGMYPVLRPLAFSSSSSVSPPTLLRDVDEQKGADARGATQPDATPAAILPLPAHRPLSEWSTRDPAGNPQRGCFTYCSQATFKSRRGGEMRGRLAFLVGDEAAGVRFDAETGESCGSDATTLVIVPIAPFRCVPAVDV